MYTRSVLVVGTDHQIQMQGPHGSKEASENLKALLVRLCIAEKPKAIAEEMSVDALNESNVNETVPHAVANERNLAHKYCDMDRKTRIRFGVLDKNEIKMRAFQTNTDPSKCLQIREQKRELYWLDQLNILNQFPVIFVCGYCHVKSFCELLEKNGFEARLIEP
ncbi:MAG: hypothetical protein F4Y47_17670 [Acidobacteriia bacterium]|nr:hypothetical protein [Terriglobia bacterium]